MPVTNVVSDVRSGKTLWITATAINEYRWAKTHGYKPRPVLANYKINLPNFKPLKPEMLFNIQEPSLINLDEAWSWLESRQSGTPIHLFMSQILFQSGKLGIDIQMTDQIEGSIDVRYRKMMNYRVECENLGSNVGFVYYFSKRVRGGFTRSITKFMPYSVAKQIFPYYDTFEKINSMDESLLYKVSSDKTDEMDTIAEIVEEMIKKFPPNAWKVSMVENYCVKNNIPRYRAKLIYGELKIKMAENIYNATYTNRLKRRESHD